MTANTNKTAYAAVWCAISVGTIVSSVFVTSTDVLSVSVKVMLFPVISASLPFLKVVV